VNQLTLGLRLPSHCDLLVWGLKARQDSAAAHRPRAGAGLPQI